ncbi:MAG: glycosyltransferase family 87 protein [Caulobacteraceae bacterium]
MLATIDGLITPARIKIAAFVMLVIYGLATVIWLVTLHHGMDGFHQPVGGDFIIFWSTSRLTLQGHALFAFDPHLLLAAERSAVAGVRAGLEWCYPPTYQLLIAPLAFMPFGLAYGVFIAVTLAAFLAMIRSVSDYPLAPLLACALPETFTNGWQGQNGFLTAALLGFGLTQLDKRPWVAGVALGLLVYKPQFGVLLPLLLIGTGRWKATAGAALSAGGFIAAATLVFGVGQWALFFHTLPSVSAALASGELPWAKIPTFFVAMLWLHMPKGLAYGVQLTIAAAVAIITLRAWGRPGPLELKAALAVLAAFLVLPYAFNYDLVLLAVPIAATAEYARRHALPAGTKSALLLCAIAPAVLLGVAQATHLQLMPAALTIVYLAVLRGLANASQTAGAIGQNDHRLSVYAD